MAIAPKWDSSARVGFEDGIGFGADSPQILPKGFR